MKNLVFFVVFANFVQSNQQLDTFVSALETKHNAQRLKSLDWMVGTWRGEFNGKVSFTTNNDKFADILAHNSYSHIRRRTHHYFGSQSYWRTAVAQLDVSILIIFKRNILQLHFCQFIQRSFLVALNQGSFARWMRLPRRWRLWWCCVDDERE